MSIYATFEVKLNEEELRHLFNRRAAKARREREEREERERSRSPVERRAGNQPRDVPCDDSNAPRDVRDVPCDDSNAKLAALPAASVVPFYLPHQTPKSPEVSPYPTAPPSPRPEQQPDDQEQLLGEDREWAETDEEFRARLKRQLDDLERRMYRGRMVYIYLRSLNLIFCMVTNIWFEN